AVTTIQQEVDVLNEDVANLTVTVIVLGDEVTNLTATVTALDNEDDLLDTYVTDNLPTALACSAGAGLCLVSEGDGKNKTLFPIAAGAGTEINNIGGVYTWSFSYNG